jgi:hypothetical protein
MFQSIQVGRQTFVGKGSTSGVRFDSADTSAWCLNGGTPLEKGQEHDFWTIFQPSARWNNSQNQTLGLKANPVMHFFPHASHRRRDGPQIGF